MRKNTRKSGVMRPLDVMLAASGVWGATDGFLSDEWIGWYRFPGGGLPYPRAAKEIAMWLIESSTMVEPADHLLAVIGKGSGISGVELVGDRADARIAFGAETGGGFASPGWALWCPLRRDGDAIDALHEINAWAEDTVGNGGRPDGHASVRLRPIMPLCLPPGAWIENFAVTVVPKEEDDG